MHFTLLLAANQAAGRAGGGSSHNPVFIVFIAIFMVAVLGVVLYKAFTGKK